ncbi:MAG: hypothetical protein LKJ13_07750 [Clostridia bacterium]|jgi:hypothetical protein|nr:hypothetical protein [Clostridia bacterium]MCI2000251.1 hypothetical protein [Clostridia bacterium]MCI2014584.1 hypothetical protein [Clostridia bacterium]
MEADIINIVTSDKVECLIAFICHNGFKEVVKEDYMKKAENFIFGISRDVYAIDVRLAQMLTELSHKSVLSCGASLCVNVDAMNGGGVIGDPFSESESASDGLERQKNGLWCIAYSGKFGCAFDSDENTAKCIFKEIDKIHKNNIKIAVSNMEKLLLEKSGTFIVVSDGCGEGALRYVSAGNNKKIKRTK